MYICIYMYMHTCICHPVFTVFYVPNALDGGRKTLNLPRAQDVRSREAGMLKAMDDALGLRFRREMAAIKGLVHVVTFFLLRNYTYTYICIHTHIYTCAYIYIHMYSFMYIYGYI